MTGIRREDVTSWRARDFEGARRSSAHPIADHGPARHPADFNKGRPLITVLSGESGDGLAVADENRSATPDAAMFALFDQSLSPPCRAGGEAPGPVVDVTVVWA
jgi:hypothetical protein